MVNLMLWLPSSEVCCPLYALNMRLGGPQNRSGPFGDKKNLLLPGNERALLGRVTYSRIERLFFKLWYPLNNI